MAMSNKIKALIGIALSAFLISVSAQPLGSKYDTKNHPKAKGVWATIRYPTGWEAKEGERPNIVQKFSGEYNGLFVMLALQIKDAGGPVEKECASMSKKDFGDLFSDEPSQLHSRNVQKTNHEGKPAFIYEMQQTLERAGNSITTSHKVLTLCYKNTMISAWCSPMQIDRMNNRITSTFQDVNAAQPLCFQFFNSLVLMDRY
jgi:hypothetical protein